jgi:hypothetical protein
MDLSQIEVRASRKEIEKSDAIPKVETRRLVSTCHIRSD